MFTKLFQYLKQNLMNLTTKSDSGKASTTIAEYVNLNVKSSGNVYNLQTEEYLDSEGHKCVGVKVFEDGACVFNGSIERLATLLKRAKL